MNRSKRLVALLIAIVALAPSSVQAGDAALPPPEDAPVTVEVSADTPIDPAHVAEMAEALGLSEETAETRLRLERASIGFEPELLAAFPDTFAGAWLETDGPPGLTVALTTGAEEGLATIQSMFSMPDAVGTVLVDHSLAELLILQERMIADREGLKTGDLEVAGLAGTGGHYDLDIDIKRNVVVVRLPTLDDAIAAAFQDAYGSEMLSVEGNASLPEVCTRNDCRYTLRGGLRVTGTDNCSSAFTAKTPNNYYLLSAAHCGGPNDNQSARYHAGERYGTVTAQEYAGLVDAERHYRPYPSPWGTSWYASASVYVESTDIRPIRYHITWSNTMVGTYVGKAGYVTNTTRGHIFTKFISPGGPAGGQRFIGADYCSNPGDSGSAVFNTNTAYGIHHGGPAVNGIPLLCGDPDDYGIFGNIYEATTALQVQLLAAP